MNVLSLFLLVLVLPQSNSRSGVPNQPLHQGQGAQGVNPMFEQTRRQVADLLQRLPAPSRSKLETAARDLASSPAFLAEGSERGMWELGQATVRKVFGTQMPPDPLGAATALLLGRAAELAKPGKGQQAAYQAVSNVLKTRHDTVKNSINNVR